MIITRQKHSLENNTKSRTTHFFGIKFLINDNKLYINDESNRKRNENWETRESNKHILLAIII
jgi:hypothetical protein